ncbi:hypothetical protein Lal_00033874 [Lupinus albus]|nr:hypothetical protein Lal_00033874 [Lupinus albus]
MLDPENQSPPMSPRTTALYAMMNNRFEALQRRIDQIRIEGESRDHEHRKRRRRRREIHDNGDPRVEDHGERRREETHVESLKVKVPQFVGLNNPEAYLEWELKIEQLFEYHNNCKEKKVKVAASEFKEYTMLHRGPRRSLIKQDEGKSQERDIKGGFVRHVFDPGGLART